MLVCLYEDRPQQIPGVKLLLLTLTRFCPAWPVRLHFPRIPPGLREWLRGFPQVVVIDARLPSSGSYNVKPSVLLEGLASGAESVLWLDTDILLGGSLDFLASIPLATLVATQDPWEYPDGSTHRAGTWGFAAGRSLPGPINSCVVRVTPAHIDLLHAWNAAVSAPGYLAQQARPVRDRNPHMLGDQDALSALLASTQFADLGLRTLHHPTEILQHQGAGAYGPAQRWLNLTRGMPPLVHAMGSLKPWLMPSRPGLLSSPRDYFERAHLELSPYLHFARQYRSAFPGAQDWLEVKTLPALLDRLVTLDHPAWKGLLQATVHRTLVKR